MKKFVDFEYDGPMSIVVDQVIGIKSADSAENADLIFTNSVTKVLKYLQTTEKKVVQICYGRNHQPMTHLIEDYPQRLRVVEPDQAGLLAPLLKAISEISQQ